MDLSQLKKFELDEFFKLENLLVEIGKLQNLVELDSFSCFKLGCLLNSILGLLELKTIQLYECQKLENFAVELKKL